MLFSAWGATSAGDEKQLEDQLAEVMQKVRMANLDITIPAGENFPEDCFQL